MRKDVLFSIQSLYRDDLRVTGYRFGSDNAILSSQKFRVK